MEDIFLKLLNMSITASWLALVVMILRLLLYKAKVPKFIMVLLWGFVMVRLVCPFSLESAVSLIPSAQTIPEDIMYSESPRIESGIPIVNETINPFLSEIAKQTIDTSVNPILDITSVVSIVWLIGMFTMFGYMILSYMRVQKKVCEAIPLEKNIWICDHMDTPFILGMMRPKIYLPSDMEEQDRKYVLAHENAHLERLDHIWKPFGFLLLSVYWFQPVLWMSYILFCRDMELACDERVLRKFGTEIKKPYADALINCSMPRRGIAACPLAFGETDIKSRIQSVLRYQKPALGFVIAAIMICVLVAVCFLTDPQSFVWQSDYLGIQGHTISAECDDIVYTYVSDSLHPDRAHITVHWTNNREDSLCFTDEFVIYKEDEIYEPKENNAVSSTAYEVAPGMGQTEKYDLSCYTWEKGNYRLEKQFYLKSDPSKTYRAYISFGVDTTYSFWNQTYRVEKLVYNKVKSSDDADKLLFYISEESSALFQGEESFKDDSSKWLKTDVLQKITLKKENFDDLFVTEGWDSGQSSRKLRENNLNAFSATNAQGELFYILEQKNGDIYIVKGDTRTYQFRWVLQLQETQDATPAFRESL